MTRSTDLKIAIVGAAENSRMDAPFADAAWQIWGMSDQFVWMPRWDRWFELHDAEKWRDRKGHILGWMRSQEAGRPIYLQDEDDEVPGSVTFPRGRCEVMFGRYFTSSVAWMLALAILERPAEIGLWGVDMATGEEYASQRPCCEYLIGWARGSGIRVTIPPQSNLLKSAGLYGYTAETTAFFKRLKLQQREIGGRIAEQERIAAESTRKCDYLRGAKEALEFVAQWS